MNWALLGSGGGGQNSEGKTETHTANSLKRQPVIVTQMDACFLELTSFSLLYSWKWRPWSSRWCLGCPRRWAISPDWTLTLNFGHWQMTMASLPERSLSVLATWLNFSSNVIRTWEERAYWVHTSENPKDKGESSLYNELGKMTGDDERETKSQRERERGKRRTDRWEEIQEEGKELEDSIKKYKREKEEMERERWEGSGTEKEEKRVNEKMP